MGRSLPQQPGAHPRQFSLKRPLQATAGTLEHQAMEMKQMEAFSGARRLSCPFVQHISRCSDTTRVNECRVFQRGHLALTGAAVTWRWRPHLSSPPRWHPQSVISLFFPPRVTNTMAHVFFSAWLISVFICFLKNVANGRAVSSAQKRDGLLVGELSCLLPLSFLPVVSTAVNLQRDNFMGSAPYREESET